MLDFSECWLLNRIHPQSNKFVIIVTGVDNKATRDSKLNDSPGAKVEKNL